MNFKKRGKFSIDCKMLYYHNQDMFNKVFKDIVVLRAEHSIVDDRINYEAIGEAFDEVQGMITTPEYKCEFHAYKTSKGSRTRIKWRRVDNTLSSDKIRGV